MTATRLKMGRALLGLLGGAALSVLASSATAAVVTGTLVAGSTCPGTSSAAFTPGGAAQLVTLCITSDSNVCGGTYIVRSAAAGEDDRFRVTVRQLVGAVMTDPNTPSISFPVSIVSTGTIDFGATSGGPVQPAATNLAVATFTIAPQATATNGSYVISLLNSGMTSTTGADCTTPANYADNPVSASFTFVQPPTITIAAAPATLTDSAAQVSTVTVTSSFAPPSNLVVNLTNAMPAGRATTACGATITILAMQTTATCNVTATPNSVPFDGNVNASVTVAPGTGYAVGAPSTASVAINNDDVPSVSIGASPATIFDAAGNVSTVTVTLNAAAPVGGFTVNLTPPGASARYTTTCGSSITVAAASTTATCTVTATANTTVGDGSATAPVIIAASATYTITGTNPAVVTIQDDDIPVISAVCTPTTLTDSAGQTSTCTISSDKALISPLTVNLTPPTPNARYTTTCASTIIIPAGPAGTSNTCTISAVDNTTLGDGNVTATLSVALGTGYTVGGSPQNVAINNDDLATINVSVAPASVAENSGTPLVYTFTASAPSPNPTSIVFTPPAPSGRYSSTCVSPIILPAMQTTVTCSVTPIDNAVVDGSVTATVTMLPSAGAYTVGPNAVATGTITDNEVAVGVVATPQTITEGGNAVFNITCQGVATVTVNYSFSGTYSPLPGAASQSLTCGTPLVVTVPTVDDSVQSGARTLTLTITSVSQPGVVDPANASATVSVQDNDVPIAAAVIPTMNEWGLMLLTLLLAAAAGLGIRRRV